MLNPQRNAELSKRKWETGITTITLFLCVIGLFGMSIMSFFQTQSAFLPLNDPTMIFQDIQFGIWIAFLSALIFQYGQNAALYVKNHYATGKIIINLFGMWDVKDTTVCWFIFWTCAAIDAGTNCLWLYNQPDIRKQHPIFQIIEYSAMIMVVGVEEVLGITLQALAHSFTQWKQIIVSGRNKNNKENEHIAKTIHQPGNNKEEFNQNQNRNQNKDQKQRERDKGNNGRPYEPSHHPVFPQQNKPKNNSRINQIQSSKERNDDIEFENFEDKELYNRGIRETGMETPNWYRRQK